MRRKRHYNDTLQHKIASLYQNTLCQENIIVLKHLMSRKHHYIKTLYVKKTSLY